MAINVAQDIQQITTNSNDFAIPFVFTAPTSPVTVATIYGIGKKHHLEFDELGMVKGNVTNATCTVSALSLNAVSYPYINSNNLISFKGHLVQWADVTGTFQYVVNEWYPNEKTGQIVLILGNYAND